MKYKKPVEDWFSQWHKGAFSIYRKGKRNRGIMSPCNNTPRLPRRLAALLGQLVNS